MERGAPRKAFEHFLKTRRCYFNFSQALFAVNKKLVQVLQREELMNNFLGERKFNELVFRCKGANGIKMFSINNILYWEKMELEWKKYYLSISKDYKGESMEQSKCDQCGKMQDVLEPEKQHEKDVELLDGYRVEWTSEGGLIVRAGVTMRTAEHLEAYVRICKKVRAEYSSKNK